MISNVWCRQMKQAFCVFNLTRESFLGLHVTPADTMFGRLRGLLGRIKFAPEDGIWLIPSFGIHTFGMLFPVDLVYLDEAKRVIHVVEHLGPFRISPIRPGCASLLEVRTRTIYSSRTRIGDRLLICSPEEMQAHLGDTARSSSADKSKGGQVCSGISWRP